MTDWATWTTVWTSVWTITQVPERMRNSQIFERLGVRLESTFLDRFFSMGSSSTWHYPSTEQSLRQ